MNTPTRLEVVPGGRNLVLKDVVLDNQEIAPCLAASDPRAAVERLAGAKYDAVNAGVLAEGREKQSHVSKDAQAERLVKDKLDRERLGKVGVFAETPAKHDRQTRMSLAERVTHGLFVLFRFGLLGVTIWLIAIYVRSSSYSADLSSSWPMALAFGFPVLILSYALSCVADGTDELGAKRRIAKIYTWLGALTLLVWAVCTARLFGFDTGASQGFQVTIGDPNVPASGGMLDTFFPKTAAGFWLLLVHVAGDVLISAACGVWSKLMGLKGRKTAFFERADFRTCTDMVDAQAERLAPIEARKDYLVGFEEQYASGRAWTIESAVTRLAAMSLDLEANRLMAQANTIRSFSGA